MRGRVDVPWYLCGTVKTPELLLRQLEGPRLLRSLSIMLDEGE